MALRSSYWVDELVTLFMVQHPRHPSLDVAPQLSASVYYWLPAISSRLLGTSEIALRLPSVLLAGVALYYVARIAARLIHPDAKWFAVSACLLLGNFDYFAADARPYALGMAVACASVFYMVRWLDTGRWRHLLVFVALAALLWNVHLLFWPFYLVYAVYALYRFAQGDGEAGPAQLVVATLSLAALLAPVAFTALKMSGGASAHAFVSVPDPMALVFVGEADQMVYFAVALGILGMFLKGKPGGGASGPTLVLFAVWWLACPLGLFAYSRLSHNGVLIPRYVSPMLPGLALLATAITAWLLPEKLWKPAAAVAAVAALIFVPDWHVVWPSHGGEGWREAARLESSIASENTPVLCPSPFVEAQPPVWTPDYRLPGFLYANLAHYPLKGKALLLPFVESTASDGFMTQLLGSRLIPAGKFLLYGEQRQINYVYGWLRQRPELAAWSSEPHNFGSVFVIDYRASTIAGTTWKRSPTMP
jgi:hypothetical protein